MQDKKCPSLTEILKNEVNEGSEKKRLVSRLERYARAKKNTLAMAKYIREEQKFYAVDIKPSLLTALESCGSFLHFRDYYMVNQVRLHYAGFCKKHLLCVFCAIRRGSKLMNRYLERFSSIMNDNLDLKSYLVTLTVKDGFDLKERVEHLQSSMRYLHSRRRQYRSCSQIKKSFGGVYSIEIKRGEGSGLWHPHSHAVWLCKESPNQLKLSEEWYRITGDSFVVDVRPISQDDPISGFLEVFKYAIKFSSQSLADTFHAYLTLSGRRLVGAFGLFYGVSSSEELGDDPLEGQPYFDLFYRYFSDRFVNQIIHEKCSCD